MIDIKNLTIEEVNLILAGLSELPTKSGAYPVAMKVKTQTEAQLQGAANGNQVDSEGNQQARSPA